MDVKKHSLCWDCANFAKGCSWSEEFRPVKGWVAKKTHTPHFDSYIVFNCPKFTRDAFNAGTLRLDRKKVNTKTDAIERPSTAQLKYIQWIRENATHLIPLFDGETATEAKEYILTYRKCVPIKQVEVNLFDKADKRKPKGLARR